MSHFKSLSEAQSFYKDDRFATENGVVITELGEDFAVCELKITDSHRNAVGGVMGGAIFTLADLAFSAAANNLHFPTVALQSSANFLSGAKGDTLTAQANCVKNGGSTSVFNVDVKDNTGRDVAQIVFTGYKLRKE